MKNKKILWQAPFLAFLIGMSVWIIKSNQKEVEAKSRWHQTEGSVFGTIYHLTYQGADDLQKEIEAALDSVDKSLSMFNPKSTLSRINSGQSDSIDAMLESILPLAQKVSKATDGAFDITVAPLVNAWGFGFKNGQLPDSAQVDSILQHIGYDRITWEKGRIRKADPNIVIDLSAIAKGFGCDAVANVLRRHKVKNFMVEIGGEVVVEGKNKSKEKWRIGVNKPVEDTLGVSAELQEVLELTNQAMATSGNYRNYRITEDGRKVAHTIDPKTGYPVQHTILSATVIAPTCAEADAFATSFMVMGMERMKQVLAKQKQLSVYIIYDDGGENKVFQTIK